MLMIKEKLSPVIKTGLETAFTKAQTLGATDSAAVSGKRAFTNGGPHLPALNMRALLLSAGKP
jgi:hypothetical protein